jgi:hypothetical protein
VAFGKRLVGRELPFPQPPGPLPHPCPRRSSPWLLAPRRAAQASVQEPWGARVSRVTAGCYIVPKISGPRP